MAVGMAALHAEPANGDSPTADLIEQSLTRQIQKVFNIATPAVCKITAADKHGRLSGTGFFIDTSGTILTTYSVGSGTRDITVETVDGEYEGRRLMADTRSGVAILKIDADTSFLPLGDSSEIHVATPVVAVGFPMDLEVSHSFGTIAGFDLKYLGRYFSTTHLRANVPVMRGQGGGPLLGLDGRVLGVLISSVDGGAGCHALPVDGIKKVYSDFVQYGRVRHGWIGVTVEQRDTESPVSSAVVCDINTKAPAAEAGIRNGDILLGIGGRAISKPQDVLDASFYLTAGDVVELKVWRDGEVLQFPVSAADPPSSPRLHANRPMSLGNPPAKAELEN